MTALLEMSGEVSGSERTLGFHLNSRTSFSDFEVRSATGSTPRRTRSSGPPTIASMRAMSSSVQAAIWSNR